MKRPKIHDVGAAHRRQVLKTRTSSKPTIGMGEDAITGADRGRGGLGEKIPQSQRDANAIARIDQDQTIQGAGDNFDGECPGEGM
jgi:hypothetical protein